MSASDDNITNQTNSELASKINASIQAAFITDITDVHYSVSQRHPQSTWSLKLRKEG
jgi:hypothetical protein